jgi:endonuclease/exonuclease/phosphatase family metal-dependent hydrolase
MKDTADVFTEELWSFPSDVPRGKIDYVFVSPDVTVLSADIPALVVSDHRPHVAEIQLENSL